MARIEHALLTLEMDENKLEQLKGALGENVKLTYCKRSDREAFEEGLKTADFLILDGDIDEFVLEKGQNLKWIHCDHSGLTHSAKPEIFARGLKVTGSAGRTASAQAEHCVLFMLAMTYDLRNVMGQQAKHIWGGLPNYSDRRGLVGHTAGIIGVGHTGKKLAMYLKTMGMTVLGYRRRAEDAPFFDRIYSEDRGETIDEMLKVVDYLILTVQLNDKTYHMIGKEQFKMMKNTAYLVNQCRGSVVDEEALMWALKTGEIAGAGVDTTSVEPLPADSPLWDTPNLIITPHSTPTVPDKLQNSLEIIKDNIRRYYADEKLYNILTEEDVYTQVKP